MKSFLLLAVGSFFILSGNAQGTVRRLDAPRTINMDPQPLFVIDDSIILDKSYLDLNPDNISSISILKDSTAIAVYGEKAKNGVIIIHTNHKPIFLNLEALMNQYHITGNDRKLRVCIDNVLVKNSSKITLDQSAILRVEVIKDICWTTPLEAGPEETYINIVTKRAAGKVTP